MPVSLAMRRLEFGAGNAQSVILEGAVRIDNPAGQDGQPLLDVVAREFVEVEPLGAGVGAGKLLR